MIKMRRIIKLVLLCCFLTLNINTNAIADAGFEEPAKEKSQVSTEKPVEDLETHFKIFTNYVIKLPGNPYKPAISSDGRFILIPAKDLNSLYYITVFNGMPTVADYTIKTGTAPVDVVISKNNQYAYVANQGDNTISIIKLDGENSYIVDTLRTGNNPYSLALSNDDRYLYVVNRGDDSVAAVKLMSDDTYVTNVIPVGNWPSSIKLSKDSKTAYVVNRGDNTVSVLDLTHPDGTVFQEEIMVGTAPIDIGISAHGELAAVSNSLDNDVSVLDPSLHPAYVYGKIMNASRPAGIVTDINNNYMIVVNSGDSMLGIYDFEYAERDILIELSHDTALLKDKPEYIALNSNKKVLAITHPDTDFLTIITYELEQLEEPPVIMPVPSLLIETDNAY
jgi:DNA-binding beta-propeller fold protein YncE